MIEQEKLFWEKRAIESRSFLIMGLASNFMYQIMGFFKIAGPMHLMMNTIYTVSMTLVAIVVFLSFKDNRYLKYMRECTFAYVIRNAVRCLDLEGTGKLMT